MKTALSSVFQDKTIRTGLIMLALSLAVFTGTIRVYDINFDIFSNAFFFNYILVIIYFVMVMGRNKRETGRYFKPANFASNVILLELLNISAYSLNRTISVFNISTNWLVYFLIISNALLLVYALWKDQLPKWILHLIVFVSNIAILFHFYEAIYVMQGYMFGALGLLLFAIGFHILVPALFLLTNVKVVGRILKKSNSYWGTTAFTWAFSILFVGFVVIRFGQVNTILEQSFHETNKPYEDNSLPPWVKVSQELKKNWITKLVLKSNIVYSTSDDIFRSFGGNRLNERVKHDPLVVISTFFYNPDFIKPDRKIKILTFMFDQRHQTERRLWRGDNLSTTDIVTNVQLFPDYRLAYTEKMFKIKNSQVERWGRQQEALYTFYLPEGSVVTSAALWVNGTEEPAYLTTKSKADSAYQAIVGVERRDPLLLHWQEGNRITVRVFPCTPEEDRQFKIGVTTPLRKIDDQLQYENIDFEGPFWGKAKESINIVCEGALSNMNTPLSFRESGTNYTYMGNYKSDWSLTFDAVPLGTKRFTFNNKSYQLQEYLPISIDFEATEIYLDINASWSKSELNKLWPYIKNKKVFVYSNNKMEQVVDGNKSALFKQMRQQNFTLFPFDKVGEPAFTLVVSKYNQLTPTLSDIEESPFMSDASAFFSGNSRPIRLYNIGHEVSPYLKTLKEIRAIQLESGGVGVLLNNLENNTFYTNQENEKTIVNHYGGFRIRESEGNGMQISGAPDHLMRLFAYNDVLREVGKDYFNKKRLANELIAVAKEAYVVTPISSLIVLETQKDYDRFDIKKSENSLDNASFGNSGAVPEPHEYLLIILVMGTLIWLYSRR